MGLHSTPYLGILYHEVNHSTWLLKMDISILREKCSEAHPLSSVQNKELLAVTRQWVSLEPEQKDMVLFWLQNVVNVLKRFWLHFLYRPIGKIQHAKVISQHLEYIPGKIFLNYGDNIMYDNTKESYTSLWECLSFSKCYSILCYIIFIYFIIINKTYVFMISGCSQGDSLCYDGLRTASITNFSFWS